MVRAHYCSRVKFFLYLMKRGVKKKYIEVFKIYIFTFLAVRTELNKR